MSTQSQNLTDSNMSDANSVSLGWPYEGARLLNEKGEGGGTAFSAAGSNICLDFHGDPAAAGLRVFSDGNHHMALEETLRTFLAAHPQAKDVFYATTPPAPLVGALETGSIRLGNLSISARPDVFIGPENILDGLSKSGHVASHAYFMQSRGVALLLRKGNPKGIATVADLLRDDVGVAVSHPENEKASHVVYRRTLLDLAAEAADSADCKALEALLAGGSPRIVFSRTIHHREIPELLAANRADVAPVYYHLALRYCRIFPDVFEFIALDGAPEKPGPATAITRYHVGLVGGGGTFGPALIEYLNSDAVSGIYESHGLHRP